MAAADVSPAAPAAPADAPPADSLDAKGTLLYYIGRIICRTWVDQSFDLKVYGTNFVPRHGGVLIVSNHQSNLDPVLLGAKLVRPMSFLAKSELFENRCFGWMIRNLNAFPVRQGEGDVGAVRETIRRLQDGNVLNLFPEGTRSPDGEIHEMQAGVGLIIRRAGVPVVPAVIDGSFDAWPRGSKLWRRHKIRVQYGPPMELSDLKAAAIIQKIDTTLRTMFEELRKRDRDDDEEPQ
jgi:1-acyl-sn-glycerol-3-phosphate acyltransferase